MDSLTKLKRKHARANGKAAVNAMNESYKFTLVGDNLRYSVTLRSLAYESATYSHNRAVRCAIDAAKAAFKAHPELREC